MTSQQIKNHYFKEHLQNITFLRAIVVDDEYKSNEVDENLRGAGDRLQSRTGVKWDVQAFATATAAKLHIEALQRQGKKVHLIAMDHGRPAADIPSREFLEWYLKTNPNGNWFWCSKFPELPYDIPRMLMGYNKKSSANFDLILEGALKVFQSEVNEERKLETDVLILTARDSLIHMDGTIIRNDNPKDDKGVRPRPTGPPDVSDDELVPGCNLFDRAVIVHVPSLPERATWFSQGVFADSGRRLTVAIQNVWRLHSWVGRKFFPALTYSKRGSVFSKDFDGDNWRLYISQFNANLLYLEAASSADWRGSLLTVDGELDSNLAVVKRAGKGAIWVVRKDAKNRNAVFRPWAEVYSKLRAPWFFMKSSADSTSSVPATTSSVLAAARGTAVLKMHDAAKLYIDWGDCLFDVRKQTELPIGALEV